MYCYHCGKKIDEHQIETTKSSYLMTDEELADGTQIQYVCPRCGYLIHEGMSEEDSKSLSRASHAQIQRGNNAFAVGMSCTSLGTICLIISIIFFLLSRKPGQGFKLVINCAEFYVFCILAVAAIILLGFGIYNVITGLKTRRHYTALLKDLNNKTFIQ